MNIIVPIKRVIDAYAKIRVKADQSGVETQNVKMVINPFDEIAIEAALQLKEAGHAETVTVLSIGDDSVQETLRTGLALGADSAIHVQGESDLEPLLIAKTLAAVIQQQDVGLVIMGKQSIDGDNNQTGQMLAALLDWPQATFASQISLADEHVLVTREVDGGLETIKTQLPAVITTDLRLNVPRYASLPSIMKAKSKPMQVIDINSLALTLENKITVVNVTPPPSKQSECEFVNIDELVTRLHEQEKVI